VQVQQDGLGDVVRDALARAALPASALTLEITETVMLTDTEATLGRLHELKALGVRLAIDDFGTGYSSLAYLHRFPVDVLKIDRAFVDGLGRAGHDATLTRAIVAIGDALGLPMVAEGVERAEQVDALRALGCTLAQGFHFARPMEAAALSARLAEDAAEGAVALAR
jgi:EAL domain-containing protein (putative c-di-GMP-specific phosphodiesterase class I)